MAAIETTFPGNSVQTNTQGIPIPSGGDFSSVLAELLKQKLLRQRQPEVDQAPRRVVVQAPPEIAPSVVRPPVKSPLERAQEHAEIVKLKAAERGPKLHYTGASYGAPWMAGVLTDDPQSMNAFERQMYLPQSSTVQPDYHEQQRQSGVQLGQQGEQLRNDRMALEEQAAARRDAQLQALYYGIRR